MDGTGHSREALHASIREATAIAQELERQAEAAQTLLKNATANAEELQQQAATAQQMIAAYQEQDAVIARALAEAEGASERIIQSAKAKVEETVAAAEASAQAAAEEILQSARKTAEETLERARLAAHDQVQAAERAAGQKVEEIRKSAEQYIEGIVDKLEAFVVDREGVSRGLEALVEKHKESLQVIARLRSEVESAVLPSLHRMTGGLRSEEAAGEDRSVQHAAMLADSVGYVGLSVFSERSADEITSAVVSLRGVGMRALLLDFRGNPGGLLSQGVAVSDLFLNARVPIVSMRGRTPDATHRFTDAAPERWP